MTEWFSRVWLAITGRDCGCGKRKRVLSVWLRVWWRRWLLGAYYAGRQKPRGGE